MKLEFVWMIFTLTVEVECGIGLLNRGGASRQSKEMNKTTILTHKRPPFYISGGYGGRMTPSTTGFGFGLGQGLTIGYGANASGLSRPTFEDYPHELAGKFKKTVPLKCAKAKSINLFNTKDQRDGFDIDEGIEICDENATVPQTHCFGKISVVELRLESINGYEVIIEKGCGNADQIQQRLRAMEYNFDPKRMCWVSNLEHNETNAKHLINDINFMNFLEQKTIIREGDDDFSVKRQSEICLCEGNFCNDAFPTYLSHLIKTVFLLSICFW